MAIGMSEWRQELVPWMSKSSEQFSIATMTFHSVRGAQSRLSSPGRILGAVGRGMRGGSNLLRAAEKPSPDYDS